ncbi:MAG TPA: DUF2059 domain-containing protein [Bryobacteraceae bacterium]|nr:DUF2059 domain-containing protein [Bryobacteraceae bacterium]
MRRLALAVVFLCAGFIPAHPQAAPDTPAARLAAAQRYLKAVPPMEMVGDSLNQLAGQIPEERREDFKKTLAEVVTSEKIEKITLDAIVKHFTVREINALAAFYGSPEGRSISRKFTAYMADVMPAIQHQLADAIEKVHKEGH